MYRVLVADDEQIMRDAMRLMISRIPNFQVVHSVGSGEEAVECCRRDPIDIVFLDMEMVGMSGIETCKRIHKYHPDISIYMVSVCRDFEFARECFGPPLRNICQSRSRSALCARCWRSLRNITREPRSRSTFCHGV